LPQLWRYASLMIEIKHSSTAVYNASSAVLQDTMPNDSNMILAVLEKELVLGCQRCIFEYYSGNFGRRPRDWLSCCCWSGARKRTRHRQLSLSR
jgi:hypothetical protein